MYAILQLHQINCWFGPGCHRTVIGLLEEGTEARYFAHPASSNSKYILYVIENWQSQLEAIYFEHRASCTSEVEPVNANSVLAWSGN
jgi:hypothetical protein